MSIAMNLFCERERIEQEAALALGRLLFAFGRLETLLGLAVVWTDPARLERLTDEFGNRAFHAKLEFLRNYASGLTDQSLRIAYIDWLDRTDAMREMRNKLIHARWGFRAQPPAAMCVTGLPTSPQQTETAYSIEALQEAVASIEQLSAQLDELRMRSRR